ncbi:CD209 antigen-like protein C [Peromyscus leucopus]|uniref:CD209 antigen-like protein C n=1 Tax=Peromyscus leucopus TaxID=10041 RepID=UPI0018853010|nr:CD209 antigen-like protein C [Peromyscus leucopus]
MMSDSMEASEKQQPGFLGWLSHNQGSLVLHLLSVLLLTGLLVAVLVQGFKAPSSPGYEKIYQQLLQLKGRVDSICRPCPWEWTFFHGKCYFFSKSQRNWNDSITACLEVEAQLVIIESDEEQTFLSVISKDKGSAWLGLSDLKEEGSWQWVDDSPMKDSFRKYWLKGEPNNKYDEDCAEISSTGWNDNSCSLEKFWICKKPASSCSR